MWVTYNIHVHLRVTHEIITLLLIFLWNLIVNIYAFNLSVPTGNANIHALTSDGYTFLRIELMDHNGKWKYAEYGSFYIEDQNNNYKMHVSSYSGNAGIPSLPFSLSLSLSHVISHIIFPKSFSFFVLSNSFEYHAGDSFSYHDNMNFSTYDRDNDNSTGYNCASLRKGGWWYNECHKSNLNGQYANNRWSDGINWFAWMGFEYSLPEVRMMLRKP